MKRRLDLGETKAGRRQTSQCVVKEYDRRSKLPDEKDEGNMKRLNRIGAVTTLSFMLAALSLAPKPAFADAPGVARISVIQGNATVTRGDSRQAVAGAVNAPLMTSDYFATGPSSYAEVQFDGMSMLRVGGDTQLRFANLDPNARAVQLADGTAELALVRGATAPTIIDTPSVSVSASQMGDYRVSVVPNGATWVTVRSGMASLITPHGAQTLYPGNTAVATGSASNPAVSYVASPANDAFDAFNSLRNNVALSAYNASSPYLDPSVGGTTDFAQYGNWVNVAGYGNVWSPYQTAGWAPYRDGRWAWENGYGWTWIGAEPWGWVPYHYGRWFYAANQGWCWYPPSYGVANGYAWQPALVGFIGFNLGGLGIGLNFGNLAWVPLAPYEPYYGWGNGWNGGWNNGWGNGGNSYNNVTYITNITNINNYYSNLKNGGATAPAFRGGLINGTRPANINQWKRLTVIHGPLPVVPTRNDLAYGGHALLNPVPLSPKFAEPRFANHVAVQPEPFDAQVNRMKTLASAPPHVVTAKADPVPVKGFEPATATAGSAHAVGVPVNKVSDSWSTFARSRGATDGIPEHIAPVRATAPLHGTNQSSGARQVTAPVAPSAATRATATYDSAPRANATYAVPASLNYERAYSAPESRSPVSAAPHTESGHHSAAPAHAPAAGGHAAPPAGSNHVLGSGPHRP